jgi:quinol monooxygenase YgiN
VPVLVATITPSEGRIDEVEAVLKALIPAVHEEDGCEFYALHRGRDRLVFVEKWRDMAALGAHANSQNIATMNQQLKGLVAGPPDVQVLEPVPGGDPSKGAI